MNSDSLIVEFEVLVPVCSSTTVDTLNIVEIKGHTKLDSVGSPEVPVVSFLVAIPDCGDINLNIDLKIQSNSQTIIYTRHQNSQ
ncbi:MAG: hypothetical protein R2764_14795 [Bacteroidales bacterium]